MCARWWNAFCAAATLPACRLPGLERRVLQRARVGERERPGQVPASPPWRSGARWRPRPTGRRRGTRSPAARPARVRLSTRTVRSATSSTPAWRGLSLPETTMLVFRIRCSSETLYARQRGVASRAASPRAPLRSARRVWLPSSSTSGSIIGTIDCCLAGSGVARERVRVGVEAGVRRACPAPMVITARHLAKRQPSLKYSSRRLDRPSRPSVTFSPGARAAGRPRPCRP